MTEIEYQEFVRRCPYDAMGDYSMFRKQQTENKSEDAHSNSISQAIWQTKRRYMRYKGVADSRSKKTGEFVTSCTAVLYVCAGIL